MQIQIVATAVVEIDLNDLMDMTLREYIADYVDYDDIEVEEC